MDSDVNTTNVECHVVLLLLDRSAYKQMLFGKRGQIQVTLYQHILQMQKSSLFLTDSKSNATQLLDYKCGLIMSLDPVSISDSQGNQQRRKAN